MQEYYIRKEGDEDSRGPFTIEQLASLAEAGQIDRTTLYYDAEAEKWVDIQSNEQLVATLFPVKKKLSIRKKETVASLNITPKPEEEEKPITVEEMLAAADGRTEDTRDKRDLTVAQATAAMWGMRAMGLILLVSAAGLLISRMDIVASLEFKAIATSPLVLIGLLDLILSLLLFLEVTSIYPAIRSRAALGIGFFLVYFGSIGDWVPLAAVTVGSIALYLLTSLVQMPRVILTAIFGLAGMGGFAYKLLS